MTEERPIEGQVAAILSSREVAINIGESDGVEVGMRFAIQSPSGVEIPDPATGKPLGRVPVRKTVVKVTGVDGDHLARARTFRTIPGHPGLGSVNVARFLAATADRPETLHLDPNDKLTKLSRDESYVKVGDPVVQIEGGDA